jgi:hypothetical protein
MYKIVLRICKTGFWVKILNLVNDKMVSEIWINHFGKQLKKCAVMRIGVDDFSKHKSTRSKPCALMKIVVYHFYDATIGIV